MDDKRGESALAGKAEYISSHIFDAVDFERRIIGHGTLIQVYEPDAVKGTKPIWEHEDKVNDGQGHVPRGYEIRVLDATVRLEKLETA